MAYEPTETRKVFGGVQNTYKFPNGYGASVVRHTGSYGNEAGLWELAVLDSNGDLDYTTPITDNVLGWLTDEDVQETLKKIEAL